MSLSGVQIELNLEAEVIAAAAVVVVVAAAAAGRAMVQQQELIEPLHYH